MHAPKSKKTKTQIFRISLAWKVGSPFHLRRGITPMLSKTVPVTMVKTRNPIKMQEADKEDAVLIAVTRDGKVFLSPGNSLVNPSQLGSKVKDLNQNRSDKTVYINRLWLK
jgi:hypothetical protein